MHPTWPVLPPTWPPAYPRHRPLTRAEAAGLDQAASAVHGLSPGVLMAHASLGVAALCAAIAPAPGTILVLCGPGNNGGDGYGAARFLRSWGRQVLLLDCAPLPARPGSDAALQRALAATDGPPGGAWARPQAVAEALAQRPALVVDAIFGLNLSRLLDEPYLGWIAAVNASGLPVLAVDLPSGLDADTGAGLPACIRAHVTATMAAPKRGLLAAPERCGQVVEVDIGLPLALHAPYLA